MRTAPEASVSAGVSTMRKSGNACFEVLALEPIALPVNSQAP